MDIVTNRPNNNPFGAPKYATGSYGVTHVDEGMLRYFWDLGCRSMLDVGCGPGGQVGLAEDMGYRAMGIEVDPVFYRHMRIALIDCCVESFVLPCPADLVWSVEVAEHIPPECVSTYLVTLTQNANKYICMTASKEPGPLHLSVHSRNWWIDKMIALGWEIHPNSVYIIRKHSSMKREFMRDTGMVFMRSENGQNK